ncbi:hypothetical protein PA598K_00076 [Paenibacillus sp. 598K]|uniref:family 16 glycoside hydrolase n=1 Tax=Paenibacillus sp. 598K TaxID=1117987 RepID=UPI000FFAE984|nr:family 16 glycoside hydrolase [Paenibacillus sp. 598K]GBF71863.1 hypothetical protein PA598K_00076 [Paenibacillus sp. 598K]
MTTLKKFTAAWTAICMALILLASLAPAGSGGIAHAEESTSTVLFQDDFSAAALSSSWSVLTGTYGVQSGILNATSTDAVILAGESSWRDYAAEAQVRIHANGGYAGIVFRALDNRNNYWLRLYRPASGSTQVQLIRRVNGSATVLASANQTLSINQWYDLKVVAIGSQLQGYLNNVKVIDHTDTQYASGKVGLQNLTQTMSADNVVVTEIKATLEDGTKLPASYDPVVVATLTGQQPAMPQTISGVAYDNSTIDEIHVDWSMPAEADYSQVLAPAIEVTGTAYLKVGAEQTRHELAEPVHAYVEVVPPDLRYFIDAGAGAPHIYQAVKALAGDELLNASANAAYDASSGWGYVARTSAGANSAIINKSEQSDLDKNATGIMIDGGDPLSTLSYKLDGLEGGKSYRFSSYHRLWWSNEMPIKIAIDYMLGGKKVSHIVNRLHLDHAGHSRLVTYDLELPEGATDVTYVLTNAGSYTDGPGSGKTNKNAAISWLAVQELAGAAQPMTYASLGGLAGQNTDVWFDTSGVPIQAHGGQVVWVEHVSWNGNVPAYTDSPSDEDGAWLWVGEDKTYGGRPIGGIHTYVSKDLYNWVDMGIALYPHRVFPMEKTANGSGVQFSDSQLAALKARAMGTAGVGVNEMGEPLSRFDIDYARDFLQAYVDTSVHPDYSRSDDAAFDYTSATYDEANLRLAFDRTYAYYSIMERPKMLYNDTTKQYVLVYHVDGPSDARILEFYDTLKNSPMVVTAASRYSRAQMGFAVSDSPFGPFKLVNAQRMNYVEGRYDSSPGMARDMTVFKDDDGKAYAIYSSEENRYTYISLLNDDYTAPLKNGTEGFGETFTGRVFTDMNREAPAVFKYNGDYYFITSGTTGWDPNPSIAYRANHIFGNTTDGGQTFTAYTNLGNPFPNDSSNTSYRSQSTAVIPYDPENGLFIYMGDRWIQRALDTSGYVWTPIRITDDGARIEGQTVSDWKLESLDALAPLQVLEGGEHAVKLGEALELPETLKVKQGSAVYDGVPVSWDPASLAAASLRLGTAEVQGTLGGSSAVAGLTVRVDVAVALPDHMIYFVSPSSAAVAQYAQLVADYTAATGQQLRHSDAEQSYDPASGRTWGYTGTNSILRSNSTDIYQSLRYVNTTSTRELTYKFDLEAGEYHVYLGFYDPWFSSSQSNRVVSTSINGTTVETGRVINGSYETAAHPNIAMDADGTMEIVVSPDRTGSNTDVQLSWIIIAKTTADAEPTTDKAALQALYDELRDKPNANYTTASWSVFLSALTGAQAVLQNETATQQQADDALQTLRAAADGLETKPPVDNPLYMTGAESVVTGQVFEVTIGLGSFSESVYAHDFTVLYDPAQVEYIGAEALKDGFAILDQTVSDGQIRFLASDTQPVEANGEPTALLKLQFRAMALSETAASAMTLTDVILADASGTEMAVEEPVTYSFDIEAVIKDALHTAISSATALHDSAVEGQQAGQYPSGSKATLWQAIQAAVATQANEAATQEMVDQAVQALSVAAQTFEALAITLAPGDLNGDGKLGVGDLALMAAAYYGRSSSDTDWDAYKKGDLNGDGVIDIADLRKLAQGIMGRI